MLWCVASDFKKDGSLKFVRDSPNRPSIPSYGRVAIASESERFQRLSKSCSMQNSERMPSVALVAKEWTTTVRAQCDICGLIGLAEHFEKCTRGHVCCKPLRADPASVLDRYSRTGEESSQWSLGVPGDRKQCRVCEDLMFDSEGFVDILFNVEYE